MSDDLSRDGYKIDEKSQKILLALYDRHSMPTRELREVIEAESNSVVLYRMREYLQPAELVEVKREEVVNRAVEPSKVWKLDYPGGRQWVEDHREEMAAPSSVEDVAKIAENALETAQDALTQVQEVQGERGYVDHLKSELQDALDEIDSIERATERVEDAVSRAHDQRQRARQERREAAQAADEAREQAALVAADVDGLESEIEDVARKVRLNRLQIDERHADRGEEIGEIEERQRDLHERLQAVETGQAQIEEQLAEISDHLETPWWRRLF